MVGKRRTERAARHAQEEAEKKQKADAAWAAATERHRERAAEASIVPHGRTGVKETKLRRSLVRHHMSMDCSQSRASQFPTRS